MCQLQTFNKKVSNPAVSSTYNLTDPLELVALDNNILALCTTKRNNGVAYILYYGEG
jgi:hypothetical protein